MKKLCSVFKLCIINRKLKIKKGPDFTKALIRNIFSVNSFLINTEKLVVPDDLIYRQFRVLNQVPLRLILTVQQDIAYRKLMMRDIQFQKPQNYNAVKTSHQQVSEALLKKISPLFVFGLFFITISFLFNLLPGWFQFVCTAAHLRLREVLRSTYFQYQK